jgi:hypothetical protein
MPTLSVKDGSTESYNVEWGMDMDIHTGLLAVLVDKRGNGKELLVFNWRTAQNIAVSDIDIVRVNYLNISLSMQRLHKGIDAFRFLSDKVMVVGCRATRDLFSDSLILVTFSELKGDPVQMLMTKVATLCLPKLGYSLYELKFSNLPAKTRVVSRSRQFDDAVSYVKPFINSPDDIICVDITVDDDYRDDAVFISFIVHSSALLLHVPSTSYANSQDPDDDPDGDCGDGPDCVPWDMWGSAATRWSDDGSYDATDICGQRVFTFNGIWDFNQYRVKQLGEGFSAETETACISVITKPSSISIFGEQSMIHSSLPYVRIVPKQRPCNTNAFQCLDDDRILAWGVSSYPFYLFIPLLMLLLNSPGTPNLVMKSISSISDSALHVCCHSFLFSSSIKCDKLLPPSYSLVPCNGGHTQAARVSSRVD